MKTRKLFSVDDTLSFSMVICDDTSAITRDECPETHTDNLRPERRRLVLSSYLLFVEKVLSTTRNVLCKVRPEFSISFLHYKEHSLSSPGLSPTSTYSFSSSASETSPSYLPSPTYQWTSSLFKYINSKFVSRGA